MYVVFVGTYCQLILLIVIGTSVMCFEEEIKMYVVLVGK
jgi:hypothetical protein